MMWQKMLQPTLRLIRNLSGNEDLSNNFQRFCWKSFLILYHINFDWTAGVRGRGRNQNQLRIKIKFHIFGIMLNFLFHFLLRDFTLFCWNFESSDETMKCAVWHGSILIGSRCNRIFLIAPAPAPKAWISPILEIKNSNHAHTDEKSEFLTTIWQWQSPRTRVSHSQI